MYASTKDNVMCRLELKLAHTAVVSEDAGPYTDTGRAGSPRYSGEVILLEHCGSDGTRVHGRRPAARSRISPLTKLRGAARARRQIRGGGVCVGLHMKSSTS